jgi:uncharacterized protein (TIGR03067 family)
MPRTTSRGASALLLLAVGPAGAGAEGLLGRAPAADQPPKGEGAEDDAAKKERKKLAGVWAVVSVESDGRKAAEDELKGLSYVFDEGGKWKLRKDGDAIAEGDFVIDPKKDPKTIDFRIASTVSERDKGKTSLGICEIDGDTLRICRDWPGEGKRPADFSAGSDSERVLGGYNIR